MSIISFPGFHRLHKHNVITQKIDITNFESVVERVTCFNQPPSIPSV